MSCSSWGVILLRQLSHTFGALTIEPGLYMPRPGFMFRSPKVTIMVWGKAKHGTGSY